MSSGSVHFTSSNMFPLNHSVLFDRPYLSIIRNQQKKKKPQFSKLSILTKTSVSTKVATSEMRRNNLVKEKQSQKDIYSKSNNRQSKKKERSNSYDNRTTKTVKQFDLSKLGLSCEQDEFERVSKQTPMSRTVCKKQQKHSISPMYSSLMFNSMEQLSPLAKNKDRNGDLQGILDRTFQVLSNYKQECHELRKQRDFFKKKYQKTSSKLKRYQANTKF